jgi:hypothetical protein
MAGGREFDRGKLKELMLLFAELSADDPRMSRVKWNKLLYRADFEAYRLLGRAITGATYIRGRYGPMVDDLPIYEEELGKAQRLTWRTDTSGPEPRKIPIALDQSDRGRFSEEELTVAMRTLEELRDYGGKAASDWSHEESVGWRLLKNDQPIPYEADLVASVPASATAVARLRERVLSGNWD